MLIICIRRHPHEIENKDSVNNFLLLIIKKVLLLMRPVLLYCFLFLSVNIIRKKSTGIAKGFAFVTFKNPPDAETATKALEGKVTII